SARRAVVTHAPPKRSAAETETEKDPGGRCAKREPAPRVSGGAGGGSREKGSDRHARRTGRPQAYLMYAEDRPGRARGEMAPYRAIRVWGGGCCTRAAN